MQEKYLQDKTEHRYLHCYFFIFRFILRRNSRCYNWNQHVDSPQYVSLRNTQRHLIFGILMISHACFPASVFNFFSFWKLNLRAWMEHWLGKYQRDSILLGRCQWDFVSCSVPRAGFPSTLLILSYILVFLWKYKQYSFPQIV